ncbi:MAG: ligase-associated DNA damage response DEXH box helicase [Bacteroidota bacterium]
MDTSQLIEAGLDWYAGRDWEAYPFQVEMMEAFLAGKSGLLNAPTGSGKTYALWIPVLLDFVRRHPTDYKEKKKQGLQVLWITPLRALAKDIRQAQEEACEEFELDWRVETRTGDTPSSLREKQKKQMPECLVTTPESLHVMIANGRHPDWFADVQTIIVDEWHELIGSKRGVQVELAIARLRQFNPELKIWGISATIGNMEEALEVLLGNEIPAEKQAMVRADIRKEIEVESILPTTIEKFPWSGHLGTNMVEQVLPILERSRSSLIFTNTRAQCELWYRALLEADPSLAGLMAMHHGSIDKDMRNWVEQALHQDQLKVVVCTSSLDLGVDFRPVETVFQVGGPKGVARFIQRAGRSGHRPGAVSKIYFVPTHSLELIEAAALREAVNLGVIEARVPVTEAWDVLLQYLMSRAVAGGFYPEQVYEEVQQCYAYQALTPKIFRWMLRFLTTGGKSLMAYEEYKKLVIDEEGKYVVAHKSVATQHRLSIGTIVGDMSITVKYLRGGRIGTVEETFISQLKAGDTFWFAGKSLELIRIRGMEALVKKSKSKKGKVPRWMGARIPLSSQMAELLREKMDAFTQGDYSDPEIKKLIPLFELQNRWSTVPSVGECLIESIHSNEGHHLFFYPFEGRVVHEILATLLAWRISQLTPITFSIAMNDYGFELLSDAEIPFEEAIEAGLFSTEDLESDITRSINETEMSVRKFREISRISGLIFQGFPGKTVRNKHLQASTGLLFKVFKEYDPENLLLSQAYQEVLQYQIDAERLGRALKKLQDQQICMTHPEYFTPFCFPIMVDRKRSTLSSEKLIDRVLRMQVQLERFAGD